MVRDLNNTFMVPLTGIFPAGRLGPTGDVAKINCATCHQGAYKPFYGAIEVQSYPELKGPAPERQASMPAGDATFGLAETARGAIAAQIAASSGPRMSLEAPHVAAGVSPSTAPVVEVASAAGSAAPDAKEVRP